MEKSSQTKSLIKKSLLIKTQESEISKNLIIKIVREKSKLKKKVKSMRIEFAHCFLINFIYAKCKVIFFIKHFLRGGSKWLKITWVQQRQHHKTHKCVRERMFSLALISPILCGGSTLIKLGFLIKEDFWYVILISDFTGLKVSITFIRIENFSSILKNLFSLCDKVNITKNSKSYKIRTPNECEVSISIFNISKIK